MINSIFSIITATGRYIPKRVFKNEEFKNNEFFNSSGEKINKTNEEIISKFNKITEIEERRYIDDEFVTSDMAYFAAKDALDSSKIDKEELDYIIVAHNFGDVKKDNPKTDIVPSLAARVKHKLAIKNPYTIAYDLPFGCPGWLQALIQADYYIKSGDAKKIMIIGAEALSRVCDPHDIDSMIYSDGAGATIIEASETDNDEGVISHISRSDTVEHAHLLWMGKSYNPEFQDDQLFLKMNGRKLYEYAISTVPSVVKDCIDKAGLDISDIKKILIHQANAKMDEAIGKRLYKLYNQEVPELIMPMTISKLGNNSVATLPILYDLLLKGEIENHKINKGDYFVFASVGAGMNVNAAVYKM
ncbi:MAG: ketoacyl-ACP synthase III [Bacteroidales bacterium]|jgi:3-oxoacyl-[acyl-carrier-protein] synthase-3|nr:ketoacyl-ACP synthase III [Bacteroidales bacterium]